MSLVLSDEVVEASGFSEQDLLLEIILMLFEKRKISIGKASQLAGLPLIKFQHELSVRKIPVHYDVADFEADVQAFRTAEHP
ncbi:MAG: UPF0175 family protein [Cyanobacteria bacterium J06626_23]